MNERPARRQPSELDAYRQEIRRDAQLRTRQAAESRKALRVMNIQRSGTRPSEEGRAKSFTGRVRLDRLIPTTPPARVGGVTVTFEPGARTAWHKHPLGQMLIVTAGCGLVQSRGGPVVKIQSGDVVWCPPDEEHWHGATSTTGMTHIAILESLDGKNIEWMEP